MKCRALVIVAVALTVVPTALAAQGGAGALDRSFSKDGRLVATAGPGFDQFTGVAVDSKGRILTLSNSSPGSDIDFLVSRYTSKGKLDKTFSGDGLVDLDGFGNTDQGAGITVDPQGRILATGSSSDGSGGQFAVFRLLKNGTPDPGFGGGDGFFSVDISGDNLTDRAAAAVVDSDRRIVLAGHTGGSGGNADFAVVRLLENGTLDSTFDGNGIQATSIPSAAPVTNDQAKALAIDSQGRIVLAGFAADGPAADDFAVTRYTPDGEEDDNFGDGGAVSFDFAGSFDSANGLAIAKGNKIVVGGKAGMPASPRFGLVRFKVNGDPDGTFGSGGQVTQTFPGAEASEGYALLADSEGRYVLGGSVYPVNVDPTTYQFGIMRFKTSGKPDKTFGKGGRTQFGFGGVMSENLASIAIDPRSQRIVVGGSASTADDEMRVLARLESQPRCFGKAPTIVGTAVGETIKGTNGPNVIYGGPGNDKLFGRGGNDRLCGGPGKDITKGGPGKDLESP